MDPHAHSPLDPIHCKTEMCSDMQCEGQLSTPPRLRSEMDSAVTVKSLRGHRAGPWTDNLDCPSFDVWFY